MRRIGIGIGVVVAVLAGLIAGAREIGQRAPLPLTYLEPGPCDLPCWQGIRPGVDTAAQLEAQVAHVPFIVWHNQNNLANVVTRFSARMGGKITLAEAVRALGPPERVGCPRVVYPSLRTRPAVTWVDLYFAGGLIAVHVQASDGRLRVAPGMRVNNVEYYAPGDPVYEIGQTSVWQGFASAQRYCLYKAVGRGHS